MAVILSLETATNGCSAALLVDDQIYARFQIAPRKHASLILPMIQSLLDESGVLRDEIDAVAFGCGPGSFMGARLATGVAQGLAFGMGCPVIPVSTLRTLAQVAYLKSGAERVLPGWDARMGDIYWGAYAVDQSGVMQPLQPDELSKPDEIDIDSEIPYIAVGNAWAVYEQKLLPSLLATVTEKYVDYYPEAEAMLTIALALYQSGEFLSPDAARPHYCRHQVVHTNASSK